MVNVRSWKLEEICREMKSTEIELLAIMQTTLRGEIQEVFQDYRMIGKSRENFSRQGGGVGIIYKHSKGLSIEQLDINKEELDVVLIVCYMTMTVPNTIENNIKNFRIW